MIASPATDPTITSTWYQENWSLQTNLCEGTNTKSLNAPPHRLWNSIPRLEPYSVPWNPDVKRSHSQESLLKFRTPSGGYINRLPCDNQLLWSPNVAIIPYTPTNWSRSFLRQYRKPAIPDRYYSEYRDSPTCLCTHPATMNPKVNKFTDRWGYRPEWSSISLGYQFANPPRREMLYLQEESNNLKFGKEDRGNGHFFPQGALINSYPVPSRKASLGPLPFANWHVFVDTDLVTGDLTASPKCPSNCWGPIESAPYQTRSRHGDSASPIGSQDAGSVVFAEYIEKDPIINSEYPRLKPDATRTNPLEQEHPEDENLVKERVSSQLVRNTSHARRTVEAKFECHIKGCGSTFTRKKNLEYHLDSHRGIKSHVCKCHKSFGTKAALNRHRLGSCRLG